MTTSATALSDDACPRLSPHYVFRWEASQDAHILLYPEGLIKLNDSAGAVLARCDGRTAVGAIIAALQAVFPGTDADVAAGARAFIALAWGKGWLRC